MSRIARRFAVRPGLFQPVRTSTHPAPAAGGRQLARRGFVAALIAVLAVEAAIVAPPPLALGAPIGPSSTNQQAADTTDTDPGASDLQDPQEVEAVEVPALRTLDSRTFQNPDGTYTSEYFPSPIHFEDASGDLKVIDTEAVESAADGMAFETKRAPVDTRLADSSAGDIVTVTSRGRSIAFRPTQPTDRRGTAPPASRSPQKEQRPGQVTYTGVYPGVDLRAI